MCLQNKDIEIIDGLNKGNPRVLKRMYERYYSPLCSYAERYTASAPDAEEIVSDVMFKIWQNRHNKYCSKTFSSYLYTATRNTAINYRKQRQNIKNLSENWAKTFRDEVIERTPLDIMISKEVISRMYKQIDNLPEQCRKVIQMSRFEGKSYEEIATQLNISENTVKYHIKTAIQKLRAELYKTVNN